MKYFFYPNAVKYTVFPLFIFCLSVILFICIDSFRRELYFIFIVMVSALIFFLWIAKGLVMKYSDIYLSESYISRKLFSIPIFVVPWTNIDLMLVEKRGYSFLKRGEQHVCIIHLKTRVLFWNDMQFDDLINDFNLIVVAIQERLFEVNKKNLHLH